ncbi:MAG TPA: glucose 1-dehydrogenase [Amycolatopsis sp.]|nr:glucose 1-dehydrogenase [Amycolatopsis sp.]
MTLEGKVAVVTGAARGIGRGYADALASAGAAVVVADIDEAAAVAVGKEMRDAGHAAVGMGVDISSRESTLALADAVSSEFGGTNILVNNAAMFHSMKQAPLLEQDIDYWRQMFSVNLDGALLMAQAFAPLLKKAGWGRVVNQSSTAAFLGGGRVYAVTKLALIGLTQGLAAELGPSNVTVNAIAPGPTSTEALASVTSKDTIDGLTARMNIKRLGTPEDLAGAVVFLCSDAASWMTGQVLVIDGGTIKLM